MVSAAITRLVGPHPYIQHHFHIAGAQAHLIVFLFVLRVSQFRTRAFVHSCAGNLISGCTIAKK